MRLRNIKNAQELLTNCPYLIKEPKNYQGKYHQLFNNNQPIHLEIGMGKGQFIIAMAQKYQQINFIGIEKYSNVMARAIKKINQYQLPNLRIINEDAALLKQIFNKEIVTIYLNFSDPWPKARQVKKRLTNKLFLNIYDNIASSKPNIIMKTDNADLFCYSILELSQQGYVFNDLTFNMNDGQRENVLTEYETKFITEGKNIYYFNATKK